MNPHPTSEQLERLLDESLSDTDRQGIERHVNQCMDCQLALAKLTDSAPGLAQQLHATPVPADGLGFLDRIKKSPPLTDRGSGTLREGQAPSLESLADWQESLQREQEFRILEKLGHGGFGVVFKAYDAKLDQVVAIKVLHPDLAEQEMQRARFEREARKAAAVRHDHVVTVYRLGQQSGLPFIVMEFIQGEPLSARLKRDGKLPPRDAAEIVRQVAQGLAAAHAQNVVHRDIKPSNILLDQKTGRAKIADFGIAREIDGAGPKVTSTNERPGTLEYMSPEHLRGAAQLDGRSDLYSLGVVLYELLTGELPFHGQTHLVIQQVLQAEPKAPRRLNDRIPADLETITLRCLAKEPGRRYQSAQELAEDVQRFLAGEPILARRVTSRERVVRWFKRRPAVTALLGTGTVAALALVGVAVAMDYNSRLDTLNRDLAGTNADLLSTKHNLEAAKESLESTVGQLSSAKKDLQKANLSLQKEEAEANRLRMQALKNLFVTQMNMAHKAWEEGNTVQAEEILSKAQATRDEKAGLSGNQIDLRGFEWYYLKSLLQRGASHPNLASDGAAVAAFPGGSTMKPILAVAGKDAVRFWQPDAAGHWLAGEAFPSAGGAMYGLIFSKDGKLLAGHNGGNKIEIWRIDGGKTAVWKTLEMDGADVASVAFNSGGAYLISGHSDGKVRIWDLAMAKEVGKPLEHPWSVSQLAVSPDGKRLVCGVGQYVPDKAALLDPSNNTGAKAVGRVYVWDNFLTKPEAPKILVGHDDLVTAVAISPDGKRIASASFDHTVRIWEEDHAQKFVSRQVLFHELEVLAVTFSADGKYVATSGWDKVVRVWESATGHPFRKYAGHHGNVTGLAFLPPKAATGSGQLVSQDITGAVKLWSLQTDQRFTALDPHNGSVLAAAFDGKGTKLITLDKVWKLCIWNIAQQELLATLNPPTKETKLLALSPTGDRLLVVGQGKVQLMTIGAQLGQAVFLGEAPEELNRVAFSADGKWLALAGSDGIRVWNLDHPAKAPLTLAKETLVEGLALTPNGSRLAFVAGNGKGMIWEPDGQSQPQYFGEVGTSFHQLALSPDGKLLASANDNYTVSVWNVSTKELAHTLKGHLCFVSSVAFSPDGKRLASGSEDWTIRIWDLDTGLTTLALKGHQGRVLNVAFDAYGQKLVSTSEDGTARVWAAPH